MTSLIPTGIGPSNRKGPASKMRIMAITGMVITLILLLNSGIAFADNITDPNLTVTQLVPTTGITPGVPGDPALNITLAPTATSMPPEVPATATTLPATSLITAVSTLLPGTDVTRIAQPIRPVEAIEQFTMRAGKRVTQAQKEAAAADYKKTREAYLLNGAAVVSGTNGISGAQTNSGSISVNRAAAPAMDPGGVPHYFGPFANYANSPMPMGVIANITVDNGGTGYSATPVVTISDVYFTGSGATAAATVVGGVITNITVTNPGTGYSAPVVVITDTTGVDAAATAVLGGPFTSGMRKFVDTLPGLNAAGQNNLGQYIPVAIPDKLTYPGSDYYEIELGEYKEKMHSDLPPTTLRGYRQTNTADATVSKFHSLGPLIIAQRDTPVRVKFTNSLPTGAGGNLFIPVDTTVMGAGMGPQGMNVTPIYYTQNRGELHLHGGATPWISDGTPYQWITPAGEYTTYTKGVSVYNVPDMPDPGAGSQTYYYTNQHSARLMFYHDHAHGITRLNVYVGEAAGYLVTDQQEQDMISGTNVAGINPTLAHVLPDVGIPLIIQDRTWVDNKTIAAQDPTWNWGTNPGLPITGDLWYPHVYMTAQNPYSDTGVNPYGRWHYGPWFFPPTDILHGPVANPYFGQPGEPPMIPGTPNPSAAGEAFMDTPTVNGVAYPNVTVDPKTYRFRVLNAADDRSINLQWYVADPNVTTIDGRNNTEVRMVPAVTTPGFPANWPTDNREGGVPDPALMGPSWIQIGTEGGFLPAPVVVPNQPITYVTDPTRFDFGNVDKHSLVLMGAERADVLVDFSAYAGKTLILYNDAPAAYPAGVPQYDYYTGDPDRTSTGGAPTTQAGYGPNVRTVMQVKVANTVPAAPYNIAVLNSVFAKTGAKRGVFESSQPPIIIPQPVYNSAYNQVFTENNFARIADHYKNFTTITGTRLNITFQPKALHDEMGAVYDQYGRMSAMLGLEVPSRTSVTSQFMPYGYSSPPTDVLMTSLSEGVPLAGDGTQIWRISHNGVDSHPIHWHMYNVQVLNRVGWDGFIRAPDATELGWKDTLRVSPLEDTIVALRPVAVTVPFTVPDQVRAIEPTSPLGELLAIPPGGLWFDQSGNTVEVAGYAAGDIPNHLVNFGWEYVWHCHILAHEEMDMMHAQAVSVNKPATPPDTLMSGVTTNVSTGGLEVNLAWRDRSTNETDWIIERSNLSDSIWSELGRVPSYSGPQTGGWAMATDYSIPVGANASFKYRVSAANTVGDDYPYIEPVNPGELPGFATITRNTTPSGVNVSQVIAPPSTASFTYTPSSGDAALNVTFTDTSTGTVTGWTWDFGDGNFANDNGKQNPSHVYELPGVYTVRLTAMNTGGSLVSAPHVVTVTKAAAPAVPAASFTGAPVSGVAPLTVTFNADASTSSPAQWATWRWTFGDGTFSSVKNPVHVYTTAGTYTVSLAATNLGGTNTMTRTGYITVSPTAFAPVANFTGTPLTGNPPLTVSFTSLSLNASTYNWSFGDGGLSTVQNPVHIYTTTGSFNVSLNATNSIGSNVLTRPSYINVSLNVIPAPTFATSTPASGFRNSTVAFVITGTNFRPGVTTVEFRNQSTGLITANLSNVTATRIGGNLTIPLGAVAGLWNIRIVTLNGGEITRLNAFTVLNPAPPTLTTITPVSGFRNTTVSYTIVGTNFIPGQTTLAIRNVTGTVLATTVNAVTPTQINGTISIPANAWIGAYNVNISTINGGSTPGTGRFAVAASVAPTLTSITPVSGSRNSTVNYTIVGTNFIPGQTTLVIRNATGTVLATTVKAVTPTQINGTIAIPANAWIGAYNVNISTINGGSTPGTGRFAVAASVAPTLTTITPATGSRNTTVNFAIVGTNFVPGQTTLVIRNATGTVLATTVTTSTATQINGSVVIPANAWIGAYNVNISTINGGSTPGTGRFAVTTSLAPTLTSITPVSGTRNTTVAYTIVGTNFVPGQTTVVFKNATGSVLNPTTIISLTATQITGTITIPANAWIGAYNVNISTVNGGSTPGTSRFAVTAYPAPVLTTIAPVSGVRNTTVSYAIVGTNFVPGQTTIVFRNATGTVLSSTVTTLTATRINGSLVIPANAWIGAYNVNISTINGGSTPGTSRFSAAAFPAPTITAVSPTTAFRSTTLTYSITGTNFEPGLTTVTLTRTGSANIVTTATPGTTTQVTGSAVIGAGVTPGLWNVVVTTSDGGSVTRANAISIL
jgi:PKD repeat protein/FtsP/CotA-like multicopper oxidase with cupredoxin domain